MRCKSCDKPFRPAILNRQHKLIFASICSHCNGLTNQGYATTHEYVLGSEEEPQVIIAKTGSIKIEEH